MAQRERLDITGLGSRGEGIARLGEKAVFVPLTLDGETIVAQVEGTRGTLVEVLAPAPERIAPFCPHFGQCGGCQLQHMAPEAYGAWKRGLVVSALERAGVAAEVAPLVSAHGTGRRRATLHATPQNAGFMGLRSHDICAIDHCPILVPALCDAPAIARDLARHLGPCDVALTASDTGIDVAVKFKSPRFDIGELARVAARHDLARIAVNGEVVLMLRTPVVGMGSAQVPLPVGSFLQATAAAEQALGALVLEAATGARQIADLFCGVGPFALRLATIAPVDAADSDGGAIAALDAAQRGVKGLKPIAAMRRDLFREPLTPFELKRFDCVVLDPPRVGAKAQIGELAASGVNRIIYVSCDPQSFARDAAVLIAAGFTIGPVVPVDQFAHAAHVELVATFSRG